MSQKDKVQITNIILDGIKAFRKKHSNISRIYCYNITSDWLIYFQPIRFTEMIKLISRQSEDNFHNTWAFQFLNITAWPCFPPCDWPFRNLTFFLMTDKNINKWEGRQGRRQGVHFVFLFLHTFLLTGKYIVLKLKNRLELLLIGFNRNTW